MGHYKDLSKTGIFFDAVSLFEEKYKKHFEARYKEECEMAGGRERVYPIDMVVLQEEIILRQADKLDGLSENVSGLKRLIKTLEVTVNSQKEAIALQRKTIEILNEKLLTATANS